MRVVGKSRLQQLITQGIELLDAQQRHIRPPLPLLILQQVIIDLAAAEQQGAHLFRCGLIYQDLLKATAG